MAIRTTKAIIVLIPSNNADPLKAWLETTVTPFDTAAEKALAVVAAKAEARANAGQVIVRVTKVDDAGSADPLLWTTTVEEKLAVKPSVKTVNISGTLSEWARVRQAVAGQPWAEGLLADIDAALGTD